MTFPHFNRTLIALILGIALHFPVAHAEDDRNVYEATVYKSPTCSCCTAWIEHLENNGFDVTVLEPTKLDQVKSAHAVPSELRSCHTAAIGNYTIEGHVPAKDIRRLLTEQPNARGLAVPGMPVGSPGMEQGDRRDPYVVVLFGEGKREVYAQH
ncbi:MAG: DUF411 domain-containing protein [Gammaproteobacteria bacterium]